MENNGVVELARQLLRGKANFQFENKTYDKDDAVNVLRDALIEANGGSTKIDRKALRRNKVEIFEIIEQMTEAIIHDGFDGNEFWMNYVDHINTNEGDINEFIAPDNSMFIVSEIAKGIATPRRQRIGKSMKVSVNTTVHAIRMYDEYSRFMANRIDWVDLVNRVSRSFDQEIWNDIYTAFNGINAETVGLSETYVKTGTYADDTLIDLIQHVEAATGEAAVLVGTKKGLMKCSGAQVSEEAKTNLFKQGYYGSFNGTPMIALKQIHKPGTDTFALDDKSLYVFAGGDKFIKFVEEGEVYIDDRDVTRFSDMTIEYFMEKQYGVALMITGKIAKYTYS